MLDFYERSLILHEHLRGKIGTIGKMSIIDHDDLSLAYTPGVARPCSVIAENRDRAWDLTMKRNTVAVISDGSAVLGLGNIGPYASIPVMEGKALLFKDFARIDAFPICLDTQEVDEIVNTVRIIAPVFGGVNLEDISAPRCFEVERRLQDIGIPVFHDDQHGTAIVLLAALINASTLLGKPLSSLKVVINGAGAAGTAIGKILRCVGHDASVCTSVADVIMCDTKGSIHRGRPDLAGYKLEMLNYTNRNDRTGSVHEVIEGADVFVGVSKGNLLTADDISRMNSDCIVFAMANPQPEIEPDEARKGGAAIVGTGRSDYPNQVNNLLAFPGVFRGALDARATRITEAMKIAAARALAAATSDVDVDHILPDPLDRTVAAFVAKAVAKAALDDQAISGAH